MRDCVILVGHGAIPSDAPRDLVENFKRLEASSPDSPETLKADRRLRLWPRTPQTDPYQAGLKKIAESLRKELTNATVLEAYNEFCSPSLKEACQAAMDGGAKTITVIPTMFTRGGVHSEKEIPDILSKFSQLHPEVSVHYAWPFDTKTIATLLASEITRVNSQVAPAGIGGDAIY